MPGMLYPGSFGRNGCGVGDGLCALKAFKFYHFYGYGYSRVRSCNDRYRRDYTPQNDVTFECRTTKNGVAFWPRLSHPYGRVRTNFRHR